MLHTYSQQHVNRKDYSQERTPPQKPTGKIPCIWATDIQPSWRNLCASIVKSKSARSPDTNTILGKACITNRNTEKESVGNISGGKTYGQNSLQLAIRDSCLIKIVVFNNL